MSHSRGFSDLPAHLRRRIDRAFEAAAAATLPDSQPPPKRRKVASAATSTSRQPAGGFIVDDDPGGGFVLEDAGDPGGASGTRATHIALSRIPATLQLLDLQPDDEEVLSVFRNAASGWALPLHVNGLPPARGEEEEEVVGREDWRAVCAVLLEDRGGSLGAGGDDDALDAESDSGSDGDVYRYEGSRTTTADESDSLDSDEDYFEGASTSRSRARGSKSRPTPTGGPRASPSSATATARGLSVRQTEECRRAFALFFPDVVADSEELDKKRIMIRDVSRVASVLKEKLTAEEVLCLCSLRFFLLQRGLPLS
jgi:hypothetical protein